MKLIRQWLLAGLLGFIPTIAVGEDVKVQFSGDCWQGDFDAQAGDIELFNLNLDTEASRRIERKECEVSFWLPSRNGYYLAVETFEVEGFADIAKRGGFATLSIDQHFDRWSKPQREVTRSSGSLRLVSRELGRSMCSKALSFKTRIQVKTFLTNFFQDAAQAQVSRLRYRYYPCR